MSLNKTYEFFDQIKLEFSDKNSKNNLIFLLLSLFIFIVWIVFLSFFFSRLLGLFVRFWFRRFLKSSGIYNIVELSIGSFSV